MASSDSGRDRGNDQRTSNPCCARNDDSNHRDENPFIAFRRYADEQISSLLHIITGLPTSVFTPSSRDWLVFNDEEFNNLVKQWRPPEGEHHTQGGQYGPNSADDSSWTRGSREGASDEHSFGLNASWPETHRHSSHSFPGSIFDSAFDTPWPFASSPLFRDLSHFQGPFIFDFMSPSTTAGWPISYLLFSPYSPLHLECQQRLRHGHGNYSLASWVYSLVPSHDTEYSKEPRWRDAFEDLLRIENDKEMLHRDMKTLGKRESSKEWLSGMIDRGSLGDGWTHVRRSDGDQGDYFTFNDAAHHGSIPSSERRPRRDLNQDDNEPWTELDLYDAFLRQVNDETESVQSSPLLKEILEERKRRRRDLEELRKHWRDMSEGYHRNRDVADDQYIPADSHETELDHYENQWQSSERKVSKQQIEEPASPLSSTVVSTITTTERRSQPDGSMRTKVVVNKRFADGREESVETEETTNQNQQPQETRDHGAPASYDTKTTQTEAPARDKKKGGWFWKD